MKNIIVQFYSMIILSTVFCSCQQDSFDKYQIAKMLDEVSIDGKADDKAWKNTDWIPMDQVWIGKDLSEEDFRGKYKLLWDSNHIYVLAEIIDEKLIDTYEGLDRYWDDDCLEIFIDEDNSKGNHQYNYNAFAYHIALDGKVADIGDDSLAHYYDHLDVARVTKGNKSIWEVAMRVYRDDFELGQENELRDLKNGEAIGFAIAYCDNDNSKEREHFIGSEIVEGEDKNRGWIDAGIFGTYYLK